MVVPINCAIPQQVVKPTQLILPTIQRNPNSKWERGRPTAERRPKDNPTEGRAHEEGPTRNDEGSVTK